MTHRITKKGQKFVNKQAALLAFQAAQYHYIQEGFLTTSSVNPDADRIELTVHFDLPKYPTIPQNLKYSEMEITSHIYFSDYERKETYVRVISFWFKY